MTPIRPSYVRHSAADLVGLALILPPQIDPHDPVARTQVLLSEALRSSVPGSPQGQERKADDEPFSVGRGGAHAP